MRAHYIMNKVNLILKYFQKKDKLTTRNPAYASSISSLFHWLTVNDQVKDDITTNLLNLDKRAKAKIVGKQEARLSGGEEVAYLLSKYTSLFCQLYIDDGAKIAKDQVVAEIKGNSQEILAYERTILNIFQRMSGIATETNRLVGGFKTTPPPFIAATRKTLWGLLDKKAVAIGGGLTHRLDLADGILIKDNHLKVAPKNYLAFILPKVKNQLVEIETENEAEIYQALSSFNQYNEPHHRNYLSIMFDNFSPRKVKILIDTLNKQYDLSQIIFEASGGITSNNIKEWAKTGVDIISIGALTHSSCAINFSLEID